jgi:fluoride exporter
MFSHMTLWHWLVIAIGGSFGATARFATVTWINSQHNSVFHWGTFLVNALGSFIMGLAFVLFTIKYPQVSGTWRSFVMVGLLGAFTTFSSFALESLLLIQEHQYTIALTYMVASAVVCLITVTLGYTMGKFIFLTH